MESTNVSLSPGVWTQINIRSGCYIYHRSGSDVVYEMSDSSPDGYSIFNKTGLGESKLFEGLHGSLLWALATNGDAELCVTETTTVNSAANTWNDELSPRMDTTTATQYEVHNALGLAFFVQDEFEIPSGGTLYIAAKMPTAANGRIAAFHKSYIQALDGAVATAINQTATAIDTSTPMTVYPDNRNNIKSNYTLFYSSLDTEPTGGSWILPDFLNQTGTGNNKIGSTLTGDQFRVYPAGDDVYAVIRLENQISGTNRVIVGYSWIEPLISGL